MIQREMKSKLIQLAGKFPVIALIGPRQSGKTTLVKSIFEKYIYTNLEEPDTRLFAISDPRSFLNQHNGGMIIDEAQRAPELFSYIQTIVDKNKIQGNFILTGSQNFLMHQKISQTLAGRVAIQILLPFSLNEILIPESDENFNSYVFKGFYPPIYARQIEPVDWFPNYIHTYLERDVRQIKSIPDINSFSMFVKLCAGRIGQLLNLSSLANEIGISINTAKSWISVLEASFIIFRLLPHHQNFNKRLVKMPKLYFYDTGLACSLLGLSGIKQVDTYYQLGSLFENLVIADLIKFRFNNGLDNNLFFWRDKLGREIDCLADFGTNKKIIEIKAGKTITEDFFKGLNYYKSLSADDSIHSFIIYGGDKYQARLTAKIYPWNKATGIFNDD